MYGLQSTTLTNYGYAPVGWCYVLGASGMSAPPLRAAPPPAAPPAAAWPAAAPLRRRLSVCLWSLRRRVHPRLTRAACCRASLLPTTSILPVAFSTAATVAAAPPLASSEGRGGSQATAAWPLAAS